MNLTKFLRYTPESWSQFTCLNSSHSSKTDRKSVCYRTFSDQGSQRRFVSLLSGSLGTMDFGGDLTTLQNWVFWMTETMLFLLLQISWGPFPLRKSHHQFMSRNQKSLVVKGGKAKDCGRCQFSPRITKEALCIVRAATREHHRLATLNNRNVFSHRAGDWRQDLSAGLVSPEASLLGLPMGHLLPVSAHGLFSARAPPLSHPSCRVGPTLMASFNLRYSHTGD